MIDLTPLDVRKKRGDFKRGLRGYDTVEVDTFMELVAERMEELVREKLALEEKVELLDGQVQSQAGREKAVNDALVTAQQLREDIQGKSFDDAAKQPYLVALMDAVAWDIGLMESQMGYIVSVNNRLMKEVDLDTIADKMMVKALKYRIANNVSGSPMIWQELPNNKLQFDYQAALDELWAGAITPQEYIDKVQKSMNEFK